ncbi:hypothetical protein GPECTOR_8g180 [Gonium pectorale]|uniref:Uncharacterized protein n=1 Tax=Gonium pectorale TaxID=33097 RepID=A0A150GSK0_GONPE|nr:hypothetical protein GPECTOR_8g180 [Gonium pectorale]|eukprot:KXZ52793.1 hypothetical protein GPECTOR_8g180 [Gonium pectorale]
MQAGIAHVCHASCPSHHQDLDTGVALRLGCRCSSGLDLLHRACADRWFRGVRGSTVCEVCGADAVNLPPRMKASIRWHQLLCPRRGHPGPGGGPGLGSLPSFLGVYTLVCLLPATISSMVLVLFYFRHLGVDAGVTMALSILTSSATILHWVYMPFRPLLHVLFCVTTLACVFGQTLLLRDLCPAWSASVVAAVGAAVGFAAGLSLFYGLLHPLAALACTPFFNYQTNIEAAYSFGRELGKGGNGVVRVVTKLDSGEEFACKSIRKTLPADASEKKRQGHLDSIRREVQVLTKLKGSLNIVKMEDVYEDDEYVHIVMEQCKGGELWHRIGESHYSERTVASFMRAALRTLAQCHAQHILHRDIKPGNFMLLSNDDRAPLKAIDFGLAAPFDPEHLPRTDLGLEGTPWYMAPETLRGDWLPASDIWAAGVMAYQLLCGRFPFDDKKNVYAPAITAIWRSVLNDPLDFSKPWWAGISDEAKDFCKLLLNRDPAQRPTAKEALKHPWLRGNSAERSTGKRLSQSVVARIQRFASGSQLKRTVLQSIAAELLSHPELLHQERDRCTVNDRGRPIVAAPDAACLQPLMAQLRLDKGELLSEEDLGEALERMGFKLAPGEVARLMEQVDLEGTGGIDRASFAASQMDWRHLQQNHTELWLDMAAKAFQSMDTDGSGVLEVDELLEALRARLPPDEVQTALELALQEAGVVGGVESSGGIDFNGFVSLLKVGSLDSLDMYDDRMSVRSNGSGHGASLDRNNSLLAASLRTGDWSRHGIGGSRHGGAGDTSTHSETSDVSAHPDNDKSMHAGAAVFRFDVERHDRSGSGKHGAGRGAAQQAAGAANGVGRTAGGMVWRFDVAGPTPPAPSPPPTVWRFDVDGKGGKGAEKVSDQREVVAAAASASPGGARSALTSAASGLGRHGHGGFCDRRMHGSDLYRNVALKALQGSGYRLDPVAE